MQGGLSLLYTFNLTIFLKLATPAIHQLLYHEGLA